MKAKTQIAWLETKEFVPDDPEDLVLIWADSTGMQVGSIDIDPEGEIIAYNRDGLPVGADYWSVTINPFSLVHEAIDPLDYAVPTEERRAEIMASAEDEEDDEEDDE